MREHPEDWRWRADAYYTRQPTIAVFEPAAEQVKKREERIKAGARVVPFGFARVIPRVIPRVDRDPILWEGDNA